MTAYILSDVMNYENGLVVEHATSLYLLLLFDRLQQFISCIYWPGITRLLMIVSFIDGIVLISFIFRVVWWCEKNQCTNNKICFLNWNKLNRKWGDGSGSRMSSHYSLTNRNRDQPEQISVAQEKPVTDNGRIFNEKY